MKKFPPLPVVDVLLRAKLHPIAAPVGRSRTITRLARTIQRKPYNNMLVVGRRGVGKSTLIQGLSQAVSAGTFPNMPSLPYIQLHTVKIGRDLASSNREVVTDYLHQAFATLPPCACIIDDAEKLLELMPDASAFEKVFSPFIETPSRRLILILEEEQFPRYQEIYNRCLKTFDTITVPELHDRHIAAVVHNHAGAIASAHRVTITQAALDSLCENSKKIQSDRAQPDKALRLLDEICAAAAVTKTSVVTPDLIDAIVAERLNLPSTVSSKKRQQHLRNLPASLTGQVIGQEAAITQVASAIQRGSLGLKNPHRPLGSFLFLGPSGVGKTELAKVVAKEVFGSSKAFVRIDMSEFADAHTAARLTGAPPGYVGYEAGGQLTNPVLAQPYSLILLDEIEKAHPSIFDLFLQVLDDGRLTDGQGRLVDFRHTIIMATSNIGIREIVTASQTEDVTSPDFMKQTMLPLLQEKFRLEFLNRFEGIAVFKPLSTTDLLAIARLEIKKIEKRLEKHHVQVAVSDEELQQIITQASDPHLGARPLKRFIEQRCEDAIAQQLLQPTL